MTVKCPDCGQPVDSHRRNPFGMGCVVETEECRAINAIAQGNGRDTAPLCTKCDRPFYSVNPSETVCGGCRGLGAHRAFVPALELEPDPFERIDTLAAELRNAYRAYERRDRTATLEHGTRAAHHFVKLLAGLTG